MRIKLALATFGTALVAVTGIAAAGTVVDQAPSAPAPAAVEPMESDGWLEEALAGRLGIGRDLVIIVAEGTVVEAAEPSGIGNTLPPLQPVSIVPADRFDGRDIAF